MLFLRIQTVATCEQALCTAMPLQLPLKAKDSINPHHSQIRVVHIQNMLLVSEQSHLKVLHVRSYSDWSIYVTGSCQV